MPRIYLCSATGALTTEAAPVGGGVAVLEALTPQLQADGFDVVLLTPGSIERRDGIRQSLALPSLRQASDEGILRYNARRYAQFALEWERALGRYFADIDPLDSVVLANDTSEGPPFAELHERGFRQMALLHVVVSEFFSRRYLSQPTGLPIRGDQLAALWRRAERHRLTRFAPEVARLVWQKEGQLARHVEAPIAPSAAVARSLADSYPNSGAADRTQVVAWGVIGEPDHGLRRVRRETLREVGADPNRFTLLTLSRISPEKRIDLLIDALRLIELQSPSTADRLQLLIAGAPAYMGGNSYFRSLKRAAARLDRIAVRFVGYVAGQQKWRLCSAADAFASPSYYEAYGLTIAQALASGTPVIAAPHAGARAIINEPYGWMIEANASAFAGAIRRALHAEETGEMRQRRAAAAAWGAAHPFSIAANRIVQIARTLSVGELRSEQPA